MDKRVGISCTSKCGEFGRPARGHTRSIRIRLSPAFEAIPVILSINSPDLRFTAFQISVCTSPFLSRPIYKRRLNYSIAMPGQRHTTASSQGPKARRQNHSCDQCRQSKRACDAPRPYNQIRPASIDHTGNQRSCEPMLAEVVK
jgi:hypothetical protein